MHTALPIQAVQCLRQIRLLLENVDQADRLKFCKADYDGATKSLKKRKMLDDPAVFKEVVSITIDFFNVNQFRKLPVAAIHEIFQFIPIHEYAPLAQVCSEWNTMACSNDIWMQLYLEKFLLSNPGELPDRGSNIMSAFHSRLDDPQVGDKVEVAWRGKFRLETQDVYQGLAWWVAEVVDKHTAQGRYKIHYPGWESRWDEWVPRSRLRWAVSKNTLVSIRVGDVVELWCCGANVPGAWLESKVRRIRNGRYCLGRVLATGYVWVERDRLRLVRRPTDQQNGGEDGRPRSSLQRRRSLSLSLLGLSDRLQAVAIRPRNQSCAIM